MSVTTTTTTATRVAPICSIIVPLYNSAIYLEQCLDSVLSQQNVDLSQVELIIFNDASTDDSIQVANKLKARLEHDLFQYTLLSSSSSQPSGVGSARNRCCQVAQSNKFIFLDSDDMMQSTRLSRTLTMLETHEIVGGNFQRFPIGSTPRYEAYHQSVTNANIKSLVYAFRDAPVAMPTVGCTRKAFETIGGFIEGRGVAEDLHFLYSAIEFGIGISKIEGDVVTFYRYHQQMTSFSLSRDLLMAVRVNAFEKIVLANRQLWRNGFSIWGAGRDAKLVFKCLSDSAKLLIRQWGDIDKNKIGNHLRGKLIVHWSQLKPPIAICVAINRDGELEKNIQLTKFVGGRDYFHLV